MPVLLRSQAALDAYAARAAMAETLAIDTEFHIERSYRPHLMLLQCAIDGGEPTLVDPEAPLNLRPLAPALEAATVVVHGGSADIQLLTRHVGVRPARVFDTQVAAGFLGEGYPVRLADLAQRRLGVAMGKGETLSDWSRRPLSAEQIAYAAEDVAVLGPLAASLRRDLELRGYADACAACTAERVDADLSEPDDRERWRALGGAGGLDGPGRATLCALAAWREGEARRRDVPRHAVVGDALLLDLARRRPTTEEGFRKNRRMPSGVFRQYGEVLVGVIVAAAAATPPEPTSVSKLTEELLRVALRINESDTGVAPELLYGATLLEAVKTRRSPADWRRAALHENFIRFVESRLGISVEGVWAETFLRGG